MLHVIVLLSIAASVVLGESCSSLHLIYARATGEPAAAKGAWSKGYGAAGYSLLTNITVLVPDTTSYPVNYPANTAPDSTEKGAVDMLDHITKMSKECPKQKYALGGHSQGGNVTFHAVPRMSPEVLSRIVAVAMFGSPVCQPQVQGRCNSYCYKGDFACDGANGGAFGSGGTKGIALGKGSMSPKSSGGPAGIGKRAKLDETCSNETVEPRGYVPKVSGMPHMAYNTDGYYVRAAACFVASQFKKLSGS